jgi:hypothetical protein
VTSLVRPAVLLVGLLALAPWYVPSLHAAAVVVQEASNEWTTQTSGTLTFGSNVTTGNAVVVCVLQAATGNRTFAVSDATNGTYTQHVFLEDASDPNDASAGIHAKRNLTGGFTVVTVTVTGGTTSWLMYGFEVSGLDNAAAPQTGSVEETSATSHLTSSTGLSATGLGVSCAQLGGSATATAGSGWILDSAASGFYMVQHQVATFSGNQGAFTLDASQVSWGVLALFAEASAGTLPSGSFSLLGVGK